MEFDIVGIKQIFWNLRTIITIIFLLLSFFSINLGQTAWGFGNLETKLIYYPMNRQIMPMRLDLKGKLEDTYFYSLDGVKLNGWYIKAQKGMPTIVYCHGQGENISEWQSVAQFLADNGYGVFMVEYRGHGRSQGIPSETGLYTDLESAVKYLKDYENINKNNIVLWGRSLGGAVVADVASRDSYKGVILESTFTNIRAAAIHLTSTGMLEGRTAFWKGMATKFVKCMPFTQKFETDRKIAKIREPLLIAASINDTTIPCAMSKILASENSSAQFFLSKRGSHHDSEWVKPKVLDFLKSLSKTSYQPDPVLSF